MLLTSHGADLIPKFGVDIRKTVACSLCTDRQTTSDIPTCIGPYGENKKLWERQRRKTKAKARVKSASSLPKALWIKYKLKSMFQKNKKNTFFLFPSIFFGDLCMSINNYPKREALLVVNSHFSPSPFVFAFRLCLSHNFLFLKFSP